MFRLALPLLLALLPLTGHAAGDDDGWCAAIGRRLHSIPEKQCQALAFQAGEIRSTQGRALMYRDLAARPAQIAARGNSQRPPRVLVIGGIHGDELTSAALVFRWLSWMQEGEATTYHWRAIPVANPDGLLASPATRYNANGVDLNRNFATPDWDRDAQTYWRQRTGSDPRRFPGRSARSEPETRWLEGQIESFRPDVVVSIHAPYGLLDFDGPAAQPKRFGHLTLNRLGVYPGSLGNYGGLHKNTPVVTIELPHASAMPSASEQRAIWQDMLHWLQLNLRAKMTS